MLKQQAAVLHGHVTTIGLEMKSTKIFVNARANEPHKCEGIEWFDKYGLPNNIVDYAVAGKFYGEYH